MLRPNRPADHASFAAFAIFTAVASAWISLMITQPSPASLQAAVTVLQKDAVLAQSRPPLVELAAASDLER